MVKTKVAAEKPMKLIEAMKELKLIEKKMRTNSSRIQEYASLVSNQQPHFASEAEQKQQVDSLIQANLALHIRYLSLKRAIERTNLATTVKVGSFDLTLSDMLVLKRKLGVLVMETFQALNDSAAKSNLGYYSKMASDKGVTIKKMFSEEKKYEALNAWQKLLSDIDSRLEVVNATTELVTE